MRARGPGIVIIVAAVISVVTLTVIFIHNRPLSERSPDAATPPSAGVTGEGASTLEAVATSPESEAPQSEPTLTPVPLPTYVVQEGDTLSDIAAEHDVAIEDLIAVNSLADPNVLHLGQILQLPLPSATPPPTLDASATSLAAPAEAQSTALPTPTSVAPPLVEISLVAGAGDVFAEVVVVSNSGGTANLDQWTLSDSLGNVFIFPSVTLFPEAELRVHSCQGTHTPTDVFWGRTKPAWQSGQLIMLHNATGALVNTHVVP